MAKTFFNIKWVAVVLLLLMQVTAWATHYRAGEILYEQITERRYRITAITYTDPASPADPSTSDLEISFGDGNKERVNRSSRSFLSSRVVQNVYTTVHEYRIDGYYTISIIDQNRVNGIININLGNTEFIAFYVESVIRINNSLGPNRSPILTKPPIDNGCLNRTYYHNPSAYDPDGDSLTFELTTPKQGPGSVVPNYEDPRALNNIFKLDFNTGQLTWNSPMLTGIYNIAILIKEYRKNEFVGSVVRDMQITIENCQNSPPLVADIENGCVIVGDTIKRILTGSDVDINQRVMLLGYGGPFAVERKATYTPNPAVGIGSVNTQFSWVPSCNHIRRSKWQVIVEAKDDALNQSAVSQNSFFVQVIAPPILNLTTNQVNNGFMLNWSKDTCGLASRYLVYRRVDSSFWNPKTCETGVPSYTGFKLIATINTLNNPLSNQYFDNNNGAGLSPLVNYCYRIVAVYPPRSASGQVIYGEVSESVASKEVCDNMLVTNPIITEVSVLSTSTTQGKIQLAYIKPTQLDTTDYKAPYKVVVKRSVSNQSVFTTLAEYNYSSFAQVSGNVLIDSLLNTTANQYTYVIDFWATLNDTFRVVGSSSSATSVRAIMYSTDRTNIVSWTYQVPWSNDSVLVLRKNQFNAFDTLGYTVSNRWVDTGLVNNSTYCYVVQTQGSYTLGGIHYKTLNYSQEQCGTPIDTVRPCAPDLVVIPPCNMQSEFRNQLVWIPKALCAQDVVKYRVYVNDKEDGAYTMLAELANTETSYMDNREELKLSIAGCYYVTGVDSADNESFATNITCIDNCPYYDIPNVFTPNGDFKNDTLQPFKYRFVNSIDLRIFNRWGLQVYQTTNIDINWDGKDQSSSTDCPDGVYYYICQVQERYLDGIRTRTLRGTIQLIR